MQTRKHPRTMREAFGPYVDNRLEPMRDNQDRYLLPDRLLYVVSILALSVIFCVVITS